MKGDVFIKGVDIYEQYKVYVAKGGLNELIAYPSTKQVLYNDWYEEDGIEADLSELQLEDREVNIHFVVQGGYVDCNRFITFLIGGIKTYNFTKMGRVYNLEYISAHITSSLGYNDLTTFSVRVKEYPRVELSPTPYPTTDIESNQNYKIDGKPLSDYNIRVLRGTLQEFAEPKEAKISEIRIYRNTEIDVKYKSKDVKLRLLLTARNKELLWMAYDRLLYDLTRPEERVFNVFGKEYKGFYKSCNVEEFHQDKGKLWLNFSITITITN